MKRSISVEKAAKILGMRPEKVRKYMREGILDLGLVIPSKESGKSQYEYHVYLAKLAKAIGEEVPE